MTSCLCSQFLRNNRPARQNTHKKLSMNSLMKQRKTTPVCKLYVIACGMAAWNSRVVGHRGAQLWIHTTPVGSSILSFSPHSSSFFSLFLCIISFQSFVRCSEKKSVFNDPIKKCYFCNLCKACCEVRQS